MIALKPLATPKAPWDGLKQIHENENCHQFLKKLAEYFTRSCNHWVHLYRSLESTHTWDAFITGWSQQP